MLDNLYENIGGKIKNWAKWIFIVEAIGAIIFGICILIGEIDVLGPDSFAFSGLFVMIFGPIVAWVGSWILYAFGELVEDVHAIRNKEITTTDSNKKSRMEESAKQYTDSNKKSRMEERAKQYTDKGIVPKYEGTGYVCPICKMAMDSLVPCERCDYVPPQPN